MSVDIRERLRNPKSETELWKTAEEAAAEIERLEEALHWWQSIEQVRLNSEVERLRSDGASELASVREEVKRLLGVVREATAEVVRLRALLDEKPSGELAGLTDSDPSARDLLPELSVIRRVMFGSKE